MNILKIRYILFSLFVTVNSIYTAVPDIQSDAVGQLYARAAVLIDGSNGRILYGHNENEVMPMASTTKIMTLVIALEYGRPDDTVTVSKYAAMQPDVQLNAVCGEQYKLSDLLYLMMMQSYNDVAVAVAEYIGETYNGGTQNSENVRQRTTEESKKYVAEFAALMNEKAGELGCKNTYFITPNGLDAWDENGVHSTTAYELALISAYAVRNPDVCKICGTRDFGCSETNGKRNIRVSSTDRFLDMVNGALGLKTGFTGNAGYCFVGAVRQDGRTFISVVLGCGWPPNKSYKWSDTKKLMNYGINNYFPQIIFSPENSYRTITVEGGTAQSVGTSIPYSLTMLLSEADDVRIIYELDDTIQAPVSEHDTVGYVYIYVNGQVQEILPILASGDVKKIGFKWCFQKIIKMYLGQNKNC